MADTYKKCIRRVYKKRVEFQRSKLTSVDRDYLRSHPKFKKMVDKLRHGEAKNYAVNACRE